MSKKEIYPTHTCFDDALDLISDWVLSDHAEHYHLRLIHGICKMPDGRPYAHAWVERNGTCFFIGIVDGERCIVKATKDEFYTVYLVQETTAYTVLQALDENRKSNHYGPWKPEYRSLCKKNFNGRVLT